MSSTLDSVTLPDLLWSDELAFVGIRASKELSLEGAPLIWESGIEGRPITLTGESDMGWIQRDDLVALIALAEVPGATYLLTYEGVEYTVRFRHEESPVIQAAPMVARPNVASSDWYNNVVIKLMEV